MIAWIVTSLALLAPAAGPDGKSAPAPAPAASTTPAPKPPAPPPPEPYVTPVPPPTETDGTPDVQTPPPGAPEDVALWRAGVEVSDRIVLERLRSNKMQWAHRALHYDRRLEELSRRDSPEGKRAAAMVDRYRKARAHNHNTLTRQWPVDPTRGCRYPVLHFEQVLSAGDYRRKASQLQVTREDLEECIGKARPALKVMTDSNDELQALTAELEALLPPLPSAKPAAPQAAKSSGATPVEKGPAASPAATEGGAPPAAKPD